MPPTPTPEVKAFTLVEPRGALVPLVFDSPHSGRDFPEDFRSPVPPEVLLQTGDLFVEELYRKAPECGAALLSARYPRIYVDPNRSLDDFDAMVEAERRPRTDAADDRAKRGIGLFWTIGPGGIPIYEEPLTVAAARQRIKACWQPYHDALQALVDDRHRRFGAVWHVNCHSMPGTGTEAMGDFGKRRPDFIVGDRDGTTCDPGFRACVVDFLESKGYDVRVNEMFRGAEIVRRHGDPATKRQSIQIEMNRMLYMDEQTLAKAPNFDRFRAEVIDALVDTIHAFVRRSMG